MNGSPLESVVLLQLGPVPLTAQVLTTWAIMAALMLGSRWLGACLSVDRPGRVQILAESFVETIASQIRDSLRRDPGPFVGFVATLFLFVLCANLSALVPGAEPPTAHIETDAALALVVFAATIFYGVRHRGVAGYLRSFTRPNWLMAPLNLVENLTRSFSLMVRLFGNVMSGGIVVGVVLSLAGLFVPIPFMALELLTGVIQAYIFAVLAAVFIGAAVGEDE